MKTVKTKSFNDINRAWFAIDATDMRLGRLATQIAILLQGKHKATYTPHVDNGDYVVVYNCDKVACTTKEKIYYRHSGRIGALKQRSFEEQMEVSSEQVVMLAVKRMLKRGPLGRKMLTKLKCSGGMHSQEAQKPRLLDLNTTKHIAEVVYGTND